MTTSPYLPTPAAAGGFIRPLFRPNLVAAAVLAALSSLAGTVQAQVVHDYRGTDGSCCHDHNGSDGSNGTDFVGASDSSLNVSIGTGTAVFVDVSGGHGGNGEGSTDPDDTNYNHWGGNGGQGATLGYDLLYSTLRSGEIGLRAASHGGNGGRWAIQSGGRRYGDAGDGHDAGVVVSGTGITAGVYGIWVDSLGGVGQEPSIRDALPSGDSGRGGNAGAASVTLSYGSSVTVSGSTGQSETAGILAQSVGGQGGDGFHGGVGGGHSTAGQGGDTGDVSVSIDDSSSVTTNGTGTAGVIARTQGGQGGGAEGGEQGTPAQDVRANRGGNAGHVTVSNAGAITTRGTSSAAILASSLGGRGGDGGAGSWSSGHDGGDGGSASGVSITNSGRIATYGDYSNGIQVRVAGGDGGKGGDGGLSGHSGSGGAGGGVGALAYDITNSGSIAIAGAGAEDDDGTTGTGSFGIVAQASGGQGGDGAEAAGWFVVGGNGGGGGNGGAGRVTNTGSISTTRDQSGAVVMQSAGGGGGVGGDADSTGLIVSMAVGGRGGVAGDGGELSLTSSGRISTQGAGSTGVMLQSIGGGGGHGGSAKAASVGVLAGVALSTGGDGGAGGAGGHVDIELDPGSSVATAGAVSSAVVGRSVGGGGGNGAFAESVQATIAPELGPDIPSGTASIHVTVGGRGGSAGNAGKVDIDNAGTVATTGHESHGIFAQSSGGGGGNGGVAAAPLRPTTIGASSFTISYGVTTGGEGGSGGHGGAVSVHNRGGGAITTTGDHAIAVLAQSVGGGGGNGGLVQQETERSFEPVVSSPTAFLETLTKVSEWLEEAPNSISFGGLSYALDARVGGNGGSGGNGGNVTIANDGAIATHGLASAGIVAQSVAGSGGRSGAIGSAGASSLLSAIDTLLKAANEGVSNVVSLAPSIGTNLAVGGNAGDGGQGGAVQVTNTGTVSTTGKAASAILAQSVGGGGGVGTVSEQDLAELAKAHGADQAAEILEKINKIAELLASKGMSLTRNINVTVGGGGGGGGNGGLATVDASAAGSVVTTMGDHAPGIVAQSVGGGGGKAEVSSFLAGAGGLLTPAGQTGAPLTITMGGNRTLSGFVSEAAVMSGGGASVTTGQVRTQGDDAPAVIAQSVSGGGGLASISMDGLDAAGLAAGSTAQAPVVSLGGKIGVVGGFSIPPIDAGDATVTTTGGNIVTSGVLSHGVMAQSVGGGGGAATLASSAAAAPLLAPAQVTLGMDASNQEAMRTDGGHVAVTTGKYDEGASTIVHTVVQTSGDLAFGVLAQSVGAGGGYVGLLSGGQAQAPASVALGALGGATGDGGQVDAHVVANSSVNTRGRNAVGVLAQSVGGGGGMAGLSTRAGSTTLAAPASQGSGAGGAVNVNVEGSVLTEGAGAIGVLAQSVGGGGGLAGDFSSVSYDDNLVKTVDVAGGGGNGGAVDVQVGVMVATQGRNAPAIAALSLGGGAVFSEAGVQVRGSGGGAGSAGGAINIGLGTGSLVTAQGGGAPAILAVSAGSAAQNSGGAVTIGVGASSAVSADLAGGTAIRTITDNATTVSNQGLISGATAIDASGRVAVDNYGLFIGSVTSGDAAHGSFVNHPGAVLASGQRLDASLVNQGVFNPGGPVDQHGAYQTTFMQGFTQAPGGVFQADVDFSAGGLADVIGVSGPAQLGGSLLVLGRNLAGGQPMLIAQFDVTPTGAFNPAGQSPVVNYDVSLTGDGQLWVTPKANFRPQNLGLTANQASIAGYLQTLWDRGDRGLTTLFDPFARLEGTDAYVKALGAVASDAALSRASNRTYELHSALDRMMSCPYFSDQSVQLAEGECAWARVIGGRFDRSASADGAGYDNRQTTVQFGVQRQLAPDWFLGASASYSRTNTYSADNTVRIASDSFHAGLALKRQMGAWQFAGALMGGYEESDQARSIVLPGMAARATSKPDSYQLAARARAAYQFSFGDWYAKPYADLDLIYDRTPGYRESGAGPFDLVHDASDRWSAVLTPSIEFGGKVSMGKAIARPYLALGVGVVAGRKVSTDVRLAVAPQDAFTLSTRVPGVFGSATAGVEVMSADAWSLRAEYGIQAGEHLVAQTASLKLGVRF